MLLTAAHAPASGTNTPGIHFELDFLSVCYLVVHPKLFGGATLPLCEQTLSPERKWYMNTTHMLSRFEALLCDSMKTYLTDRIYTGQKEEVGKN